MDGPTPLAPSENAWVPPEGVVDSPYSHMTFTEDISRSNFYVKKYKSLNGQYPYGFRHKSGFETPLKL